MKGILQMKKRLLALCSAYAVCLSIIVPANALTDVPNEASLSQISIVEDTMSEYDKIIELRSMAQSEALAVGYSLDEYNYIESNAIEDELLYRATLSDDVLKEHYRYNDKMISILREYDGQRLEMHPELRAVLATFSTNIQPLTWSASRLGIAYSWEWDVKPVITDFTDIIAVTWEATFNPPAQYAVRFDSSATYVLLNYFYSNTQKDTRTLYITSEYSEGVNRNCYRYFPMDDYTSTGLPVWCQSGMLFLYVDLVNTDGQGAIYDVAFHFEYGHQTIELPLPGVSFPASLSISFTPGIDEYGVRNATLGANGRFTY